MASAEGAAQLLLPVWMEAAELNPTSAGAGNEGASSSFGASGGGAVLRETCVGGLKGACPDVNPVGPGTAMLTTSSEWDCDSSTTARAVLNVNASAGRLDASALNQES